MSYKQYIEKNFRKDACAEVDHAQGRKTAALNKLNGLQKDLTEAIMDHLVRG